MLGVCYNSIYIYIFAEVSSNRPGRAGEVEVAEGIISTFAPKKGAMLATAESRYIIHLAAWACCSPRLLAVAAITTTDDVRENYGTW